MAKNIEEISKIAAEWWADKVINPKFDNGDESENGFFAMGLAMLNTKPVDKDAKIKFIKHLSKSIENELSEFNGDSRYIIEVDYAPCSILSDAAEYAGIPNTNFPWKTTMFLNKKHISVSYGYRGKDVYLYSTKSYWKSYIDANLECIEDYRNGKRLDWIPDEEKDKARTERIANCQRLIEEYEINLENAEE